MPCFLQCLASCHLGHGLYHGELSDFPGKEVIQSSDITRYRVGYYTECLETE